MDVKKRNFKIVIALLIIVALVPIFFIMKEVLYWKLLARDIEEKNSTMSASELETKLIEELEKTALNINNSSYNTVFEVCDDIESDVNKETDYLMIYYELLKSDNPNATNPYEGYILACITQNNTLPERVYIPCFKVESDDNGKVKNITYPYGGYFGYSGSPWGHLESFLKELYKVERPVGSIKYFKDKYENFPFEGKSHNYDSKEINIFCTDNDFGATVLSQIYNNEGYNLSDFEIKQDLINKKVNVTFESWN